MRRVKSEFAGSSEPDWTARRSIPSQIEARRHLRGAFRGDMPAVLPAVIINRAGVMDAVERAIVSDATSQSTIRSSEWVHCGGWWRQEVK